MGDAKRQFVDRLFTTIAPRYDWFNRLASCGLDQRWRRQAVREGCLAPGMRVLDVCTGTGDLALLCACRLQDQGVVIGSDYNVVMLDGARRKHPSSNNAVRWVRADAQALPFRSERFDRVIIGFSTRNLSDLRTGCAEMVRVLKPGGRLMILETGRPSNPMVRAGYRLFLMTMARGIGWLLTGRLWPFTYLAQSVKRFLTPSQMVELLTACGTSARYRPLSFGLASLYLADKR
ncbi:MAG: ubiquinone/menaquinone biosynthesis methyltransferase [Candidatus Omnitrophica bacterium]|nr:ubiquinone/menaquinone biosynthesis methyltransferase [Candidatus Omnitrophota bacterium]